MITINKSKRTIAKQLVYLGGSICEGQDIKGVQKAPDLIREANIFKALKEKYDVETKDLGNISAKNYVESEINQQQAKHHVRNLQLLDNLLGQINDKIHQALTDIQGEKVMVTVGGDHSVGTPTLHALNSFYKDLRIIWVDAHPDFVNPLQSPYENYHGYPVSHVTGLASSFPGFSWLKNHVPFENIVYIAIRQIDPDEWINLKKYNMKCFTMDHVTQLGIGEVLNQAIAYLDPVGNKPFHISFDIDAIDPQFAFGTGTKFRGGLTPIQANQIIKVVSHQRKLVGLDIMEINQDIEIEQGRRGYYGEHYYGMVSPTVGLGLDLIDSIFQEYFTL